jgi:hypothetical protein
MFLSSGVMSDLNIDSVFNVKGGENMDNQNYFLKLHLSFFRSGLAAKLKPLNTGVFLTICSYMNEQGECYPSVEQIAERSGVSKRTVIRSIKNLLEFRFYGKPILTRELIKDGDQILRSEYKVQPISQVAIFDGEIERVPDRIV